MHYRWLLLGTLFLPSGCSQRLSTPINTQTSATPDEAFACVRKQLTTLGYKQTSIDVDERRISAAKIDTKSRRPDTQFRRILDKVEVEVAPRADGQTGIEVRPHTYAEYTTQRGPTEVEEQVSDQAKSTANALLARCRG